MTSPPALPCQGGESGLKLTGVLHFPHFIEMEHQFNWASIQSDLTDRPTSESMLPLLAHLLYRGLLSSNSQCAPPLLNHLLRPLPDLLENVAHFVHKDNAIKPSGDIKVDGAVLFGFEENPFGIGM